MQERWRVVLVSCPGVWDCPWESTQLPGFVCPQKCGSLCLHFTPVLSVVSLLSSWNCSQYLLIACVLLQGVDLLPECPCGARSAASPASSCLLLCTKGSQEAQSPAWMCPVFVWLKSKWVIWRGFTEAGVLTPLFFCDKPLFPLWWGSPVRLLVCIRGFFGGLPVNAVKREVQVRLSSLGMFTGLSKP